jgi:7,8-dihydroneopterin aldolase/epimerase/oxygenase
MNGRIHLKNMLFYGYHGDLAEENKLGQRFIVDLTLSLDIAEVARTDALDATVDYVAVHEVCRQLVEGEKVRMSETLAARIAEKLLAGFPRLTAVDVTVKKPSVPMKGVLDYVAVETSRSR